MDSPIPPVAAIQPLPPVLPPAEKSKSWLKILLAIIGVLVILGLFGNLYLLARNQKLVAEITPTPTLIAATPTPDLTANWKTYVSQALRISFKYPDSYVEPKESNNYLSVISQLNPNRPAKDSSLQNGELKIEIVTEPAKSENTPESCWSDHNGGGGKIIGDGSIGIAGSQLKTIIWEGEGTGEFTCLLRNNTRYLINKYPAKTSRQDEYKLIFSTFKFLDQESSGETFSNDNPKIKVRYSLKYPSGWYVTSHEMGPRGAGYDGSRDLVTLSDGSGISIIIYQTVSDLAGSGRFCLFPKDSDCEGLYTPVCDRYGDYTEFMIFGKKARRAQFISGENLGHEPNSYYICEEYGGKFMNNTSFGKITYKVPQNVSLKTLNEMDSIIKSLRKE